jgi:phosphatidylserine/phosphatidylglycerophosphate/cardiolipin synthase-like enzyme
MRSGGSFFMKKLFLSIFLFLLLPAGLVPPAGALPAEDVQVITDSQYFQAAQKMIRESKEAVQVVMFEMGYYDEHPNTPSNLLVRELIEARKRGVKVEVILDVREGEDRTTKRNRRAGKVLSDGGVEVIYDSLSKTTHAKMMIVDRRAVLVGSTNWTYYALTNNHEVAVLVRSKEVANEMADYFSRVKATGTASNPKSQAPNPKHLPGPHSK